MLTQLRQTSLQKTGNYYNDNKKSYNKTNFLEKNKKEGLIVYQISYFYLIYDHFAFFCYVSLA